MNVRVNNGTNGDRSWSLFKNDEGEFTLELCEGNEFVVLDALSESAATNAAFVFLDEYVESTFEAVVAAAKTRLYR